MEEGVELVGVKRMSGEEGAVEGGGAFFLFL